MPAFVPWCGAAVMLLALWLFCVWHADLGQNWSVSLEVRKGHQLVKHGVYRMIRHPMYAAIFLWCIAQGLLLANWLAGWSAFATFALMYVIRTPREERMMCEFFGQEYRDYMGQTGRLFRIRKTRIPSALDSRLTPLQAIAAGLCEVVRRSMSVRRAAALPSRGCATPPNSCANSAAVCR